MRVYYTITKTQYHLLSGSPCLYISVYVLRVLASGFDHVFSLEIVLLRRQTYFSNY